MYFAVLQEEQFCMLSLRSDCFPVIRKGSDRRIISFVGLAKPTRSSTTAHRIWSIMSSPIITVPMSPPIQIRARDKSSRNIVISGSKMSITTTARNDYYSGLITALLITTAWNASHRKTALSPNACTRTRPPFSLPQSRPSSGSTPSPRATRHKTAGSSTVHTHTTSTSPARPSARSGPFGK